MPGTVVVLMPAADIRGSDARTLAASCTAALREGECVVSENATPAAIAVATVTVRAAGKVHIDVDVRATDASPSRHPSRDLSFRDADPLEERWKSVGFAIASMSGAAGDVAPGASADGTTKEGTEASGPSGAASGPSGAASGPSGAASGPSGAASGPSGAASGPSGAASAASGATAGDAKNDATSAAPAATPEKKRAPNSNGPATRAPQNAPPQEDDVEGAHRFRAGGAFETGPGLTHGTWRVGGALGLGYDFDDGFWAVDALGGYAANPADVSGVDVSWLTFAAGASVAWSMYGVQGRVGALLGAREVRASESDGATGEHQTLTRWLPVGIARASLRWPATGTLGMFSGLSLARTTGGTAIASHGTYIGSSAAFELGLFLGVEVRP